MKIIKPLLVAAATAMIPIALHAQDEVEVKTTADIAKTIADVYQTLDTAEIRIDGYIGAFIADILYYADEFGRYQISLDAGRTVRRQIDGCTLEFDYLRSSCKIVGIAEIKVDENDREIADGVNFSLILYEVESFEKKAP